ncbi:MAG: glycosyl hydrolase family 28-related protein, partial [Christensenellales bacterium]
MLIATLIFALSLSGIGNVFADKFDAGNDYKIVGTDNNDGSYIVSAFNVKDYGAVGDGVADDTQAIENTISAMVFGPRTGVIYFPAGKYRVTKPGFNVFANCTVIGQWNDPSSDSEKEETVIIADYVSDKGVP